jgi:hypothetical protein
MDIRDILKSFDQLSEATTTTDKGTVHKAGPGGYGNRHGSEDVTDQYGKPIGRASLSKMNTAPPVKRGKGRPPKNADSSGEVKSYDSSALSKAMGIGKAPKPTGKPSVKHSLKEYFDQMDEALSEAGLAVQPLPATPQQKQQQQMATKPSFMIKDPANPSAPAITTQDPAVVQAAKNGTMSMQKPGAAPTAPGATPAAGAGSQVKPMEEDDKNWIKGAIKHPGAFTKKASSHGMTPKEFANKVLAHKKDYPAKTEKQAQLAKTLGKMHESHGMTEAGALDWKSMINSNASVGELRDMFEKYNISRSIADFLEYAKDARNLGQAMQYFDKKSLEDEDYGRRVDREYGGNVSSGYYQLQDLMSEQMEEAEAPQHFAQSSPLSTANRGVLESKKGVNPFAKKDTKKKPDENNNNIPDYAEDGKGKKDLKKKGAAPKKGVNPFAKKTEKKKVKEGTEHHLQAARLEGKSHALRKMPYNCTHDDMEEARCYHDGFKEGLDECYGQMPILGRTSVGESSTDNLDWKSMITPTASIRELRDMFEEYNLPRDIADFLEYAKDARNLGQAMAYFDKKSLEDEDYGNRVDDQYGADITGGYYHLQDLMDQGASLDETEVGTMASYGADKLGEMDKTSYMKQQAIKTPGNTFKAFGQTMSDKNVIDEFAFEALDKQLNAILEGKEVSEGMTVSISKGQQGSPDSVSVSAQDGEADQLLSIIKSAGMGLFGGDEQNGYGAPQGSAGAHGGISVVDDHDGMMALMKKLSGGGEMVGAGDYESEEGHGDEGHMHGDEETCNECGGMMEENHRCDSGQQVVDEVESEDQMEFEVAENAPDSGADNTDADVAGQVGSDEALATADAAQDMATAKTYSSPTEGKEDTTGEEAGKEKVDEGDNCKKCDCNPCKCETVAESFANLYKKLAFLSEESTEKKDEKAEKAGKKVANDIESDEGHKGKDDNNAEKAGKKVTKDIEYDDKKDEKYKKDKKVDESYANSADDTFEADIDFMTKVISGGLNKQKSTGQTTIPVINGQKNRMGADGLGNPMKESNDLLKDYRKLSGL